MTKTKIGKVGLTPKGEYSSTFSYKRLDVVTKSGSSYICLKNCVGIDVTNTEYWQLSASKGDLPANGIDYNTTKEKEAFKNEVVEYAEQEIDTYAESKEASLDTYTNTKKEELDNKETILEKDLTDKKDSLVEEIEEAKNGFDDNVTTKTTEFNSNATSKTNTFNMNATEQTNTFNQNSTDKTSEFNQNAEQKTEDFNNNAESYNNRIQYLENLSNGLLDELENNTVEDKEITVTDSAKAPAMLEIKAVECEQETREGYNKALQENITATVNGYINMVDTGIFGIVEAGKDYTLCFITTATSVAKSISVRVYNNSETQEILDYINTSTEAGKISLKKITPSVSGFLGLNASGFTPNECVGTNVMLLEGVYTAENLPGYEKYGAMPSLEFPSLIKNVKGNYNIKKQNANLLQLPATTKTNGNLELNFKEDGNIVINGKSENALGAYIPIDLTLKPGTYTFGLKEYLQQGVTLSLGLNSSAYSNTTLTGNGSGGSNYKKSKTFILTETTIFNQIRIYIDNKNIVYSNYKICPILCFGETITDFAGHKEQTKILNLGDIELNKIGDVEDSIDIEYTENAGYKKITSAKYTKNILSFNAKNLTGWAKGSASNDTYSVFQANFKNFTNNITCLCNKLKNYNNNSGVLNRESIYLNDGAGYSPRFAILNSRLTETTTQAFVEYVKTADIIVHYIAITPEVVEITDEVLLKQLEELINIETYHRTTHISVESTEDNLLPKLKLTYKQSSEIINKNKNEALEARVTAIESLLSTTETSALLLDNLEKDLEGEIE